MSLMPKTRFTRHGYLRIVGGEGKERRLELYPEDVAEILDNDKAVPVGRDPKAPHRLHRAFYSIPDDECIIAVQDDENGEVITLLPFSHHGRFALDTIKVRKMAMQLMGISLPLDVECERIVAEANTDCIIAMEFRRPTHASVDMVRLKRMPVAEGQLLHEVLHDAALTKEIETECIYALGQLLPGTQITRLRVHFVSGSTASQFHWVERDAFF